MLKQKAKLLFRQFTDYSSDIQGCETRFHGQVARGRLGNVVFILEIVLQVDQLLFSVKEFWIDELILILKGGQIYLHQNLVHDQVKTQYPFNF